MERLKAAVVGMHLINILDGRGVAAAARGYMIRAPTGHTSPYPHAAADRKRRLFWRQDRPLPFVASRKLRQERSFLWHFLLLRLVFFRPS